MCSGRSDTPSRVPGFPIRISTDQSLVGSSPWLFAATHVLHRCQTPRHPPLALCSLEEQRCSCSLCSSQGARPARKDAGSGDEGAGVASVGLAGGASRYGRVAPSKQKRGTVARSRSDHREVTPTTDDVAWTRPSEAPTGSRSCGEQEH